MSAEDIFRILGMLVMVVFWLMLFAGALATVYVGAALLTHFFGG